MSEENFWFKPIALKVFQSKKAKRDKRLEKNWSSLKLRIEYRKNRKSLKIQFLWKNDAHLYIQGDNSLWLK